MEKISKGIVFSNDIKRILKGCNALDFKYSKNGIIIPSNSIFTDVRDDFRKEVNNLFNREVTIITEKEMYDSLIYSISDIYKTVPIVSLDKVYLDCDEKDIISLDCTRLDKTSALVSRKNPNDLLEVDRQIKNISNNLKNNNQKYVVLADDVVFSGNVLKTITKKFADNEIEVLGIRSSISTIDGYEYFNKNLPLGLKCGYVLGEDVIDQICERDFYFGIAQSGISINKDNVIYKAPYFYPYGDPCARASIPEQYADSFSKNCLKRSLLLWEGIEDKSKMEILIKDLPEKIVNTKDDESVTKVLRKEFKKL